MRAECLYVGDIVHLNVAGQPVIMLNSQKVAADLLDRRAANNSGRPRLIVASELMCDDLLLALEPHNERCVSDVCSPMNTKQISTSNLMFIRWRRQRRAIHEGFNRTVVNRFHPALVEDAVQLALAVCHDAAAFRKHYRNFAGSAVLAITYDKPLRGSSDDEAMHMRVDDFVKRVQAASAPGAHFVEMAPFMLWLPSWMAGWKHDALKLYRETSAFFLSLVDEVDARVVRSPRLFDEPLFDQYKRRRSLHAHV